MNFQNVFLVINRAWKILENEKTRKRCLEIVEEAKGMTELAVIYILIKKFINFYCIIFNNNEFFFNLKIVS